MIGGPVLVLTTFHSTVPPLSRCSLVLLPSDRDVVGPDDVDQQFDVSVRQVLRRHLLPLLPLRFQRSLGFGQLEQVDSQEPARGAGGAGGAGYCLLDEGSIKEKN